MSDPRRVVMRVRPLVQLVAVPLLGVFVLGIGWGIVDSITHGDIGSPFRSSHLGGVGITVGWCIAGVAFLLCAFGVAILLRLRVVVTPEGFDARAFVRHHRLTLEQVTGVAALSGTPYPTTQPKFPGIRVTARDAAGRRRGFQLNSVYTGTERAMPVLASWVRTRPELVQDETTRALFRSHGVDVPPTPPRGQGPQGHSVPGGSAPQEAVPTSHRFTLSDGTTTREVDSPGL